jgi:hypothetical protein
VEITFTAGGRTQVAEWIFDPRRRHIAPDDDVAARLCLPADELPDIPVSAHAPATATVTPIAPRLGGLAAHHPEQRAAAHPEQRAAAAPPVPAAAQGPSASPGRPAVGGQGSREADAERRAAERDAAASADERGDQARERSARERPARKAAGGRSRRASVPSWDEIMFGSSRQPD